VRSADRWLLAATLVVIDVAVFVVPLTGLFGAYVLLVRPPWFRRWVEELYSSS
jgi:hypothetical protein